MALLNIVDYPAAILTQAAEEVNPQEINDKLRKIISDMMEIMQEAPGVGLAAPQVNISKRFFVVDVSHNEKYQNTRNKPFCLINPQILEKSGTTTYEEGCLSLPEFRETVERAKKIKVHYLDEWGKEQILEDDDFLAIVIQHETDHLNGIMAIDRISPMKKMIYLKKLKKLQKEAAASA